MRIDVTVLVSYTGLPLQPPHQHCVSLQQATTHLLRVCSRPPLPFAATTAAIGNPSASAMSIAITITANKIMPSTSVTFVIATSASVLDLGELYPRGQELLCKLTLPSQRLLVILHARGCTDRSTATHGYGSPQPVHARSYHAPHAAGRAVAAVGELFRTTLRLLHVRPPPRGRWPRQFVIRDSYRGSGRLVGCPTRCAAQRV